MLSLDYRARMIRALVLLAMLAWVPSAHAMGLRTRFIVLAFSSDGASALVEVRVQGPEGGGEVGYELWSASAPHVERYTLSSDLSSGGGKHPQRIPAKTCVERLRSLDQVLKRRGFAGVKIKPATCKGGDYYLTTLKRQSEAIHDARFREQDGVLAHDDYRLNVRGETLELTRGDAKLCSITRPAGDTATPQASVSSSGQLFFVVEDGAGENEVLRGLCGGTPVHALPLTSAR